MAVVLYVVLKLPFVGDTLRNTNDSIIPHTVYNATQLWKMRDNLQLKHIFCVTFDFEKYLMSLKPFHEAPHHCRKENFIVVENFLVQLDLQHYH